MPNAAVLRTTAAVWPGLKEENQMLNGDGSGDNLEGINHVATAYDTSLNQSGDTRADIIAHAIYQVTESNSARRVSS
jgi:hypothetical protein